MFTRWPPPRADARRAATAMLTALAVLASAAGLTACSDDHHTTSERGGLIQTLTTSTPVTTKLGVPGDLAIAVAGHRHTTQDQRPVVVRTRRNTAGVVAAYDPGGNQRGLALVVNIDGVPRDPVHVTYRSTALSELILTPGFLTDNPLGILAVRHAATRSPHLGRLTKLLKAHAAHDPAYLQHPTTSELDQMAALGVDVNTTLRAESHFLTASPEHDAAPAGLRMQGTACGDVLHQYHPANTGACFNRADSDKPDQPGVDLAATNTSPNWDVVFSARRTALPLALVPPHKVTIPTLSDLLGVVLSVIGNAAKAGACEAWNTLKHLFGFGDDDKCTDSDILKPITHFLANFAKDGQGNLTISPKQSTSPMFAVEGAKDTGDRTAVPDQGAAGVNVEAWHNVAFMLTVWSQFVSPLIAVITDSPSHETDQPPPLTGRQGRAGIVKEIAKVVDSDVVTLGNDMSSASTTTLMKDFFGLVWKLIASPGLLTAILKIRNADQRLAKALKRTLEKIAPNLIPGIGWAKTIIDAGDRLAHLTTVGFGLYALAVKVPQYDSYISYRPLQGSSPPPTASPRPTQTRTPPPTRSNRPTPTETQPHPSTSQRFRAETWKNQFFTIRIHRSGHVVIQRWTGQRCQTVQSQCDHARKPKQIPGAVARGHLRTQSPLTGNRSTNNTSMVAEGSITSASPKSGLPTGTLHISASPRGGITAYIGEGGGVLQSEGPLYLVISRAG